MTPLFWYGFAAGVGTVVAALMFAALVSRLFGEPAAHRAGIDEDEDDPEPVLRIQPNLYPRGMVVEPFGVRRVEPVDEAPTEIPQPPSLGPPPTYPETSRLLPGPPSGGRRDAELAGGDAETRTRPADESHPPR
jgi:hypothetical protein